MFFKCILMVTNTTKNNLESKNNEIKTKTEIKNIIFEDKQNNKLHIKNYKESNLINSSKYLLQYLNHNKTNKKNIIPFEICYLKFFKKFIDDELKNTNKKYIRLINSMVNDSIIKIVNNLNEIFDFLCFENNYIYLKYFRFILYIMNYYNICTFNDIFLNGLSLEFVFDCFFELFASNITDFEDLDSNGIQLYESLILKYYQNNLCCFIKKIHLSSKTTNLLENIKEISKLKKIICIHIYNLEIFYLLIDKNYKLFLNLKKLIIEISSLENFQKFTAIKFKNYFQNLIAFSFSNQNSDFEILKNFIKMMPSTLTQLIITFPILNNKNLEELIKIINSNSLENIRMLDLNISVDVSYNDYYLFLKNFINLNELHQNLYFKSGSDISNFLKNIKKLEKIEYLFLIVHKKIPFSRLKKLKNKLKCIIQIIKINPWSISNNELSFTFYLKVFKNKIDPVILLRYQEYSNINNFIIENIDLSDYKINSVLSNMKIGSLVIKNSKIPNDSFLNSFKTSNLSGFLKFLGFENVEFENVNSLFKINGSKFLTLFLKNVILNGNVGNIDFYSKLYILKFENSKMNENQLRKILKGIKITGKIIIDDICYDGN